MSKLQQAKSRTFLDGLQNDDVSMRMVRGCMALSYKIEFQVKG